MKKIFFAIAALLSFFAAFSQSGTGYYRGRRIWANETFRLRDYSIDTFTNSSSGWIGMVKTIPTANAIANYVSAAVGGVTPGESNTGANLGGGLANYDSKSGVTLRFNSFTASDFNLASNLISIDYTNGQAASSVNKGFLTSADWTTFNGKAAATGGTGYIQNQSSSAQSASFYINGQSRINNELLLNTGDAGNYSLQTGGDVILNTSLTATLRLNNQGNAVTGDLQATNGGVELRSPSGHGIILKAGTPEFVFFPNGNIRIAGVNPRFADNGIAFQIAGGALWVSTIANATTNTGKILVSDGGTIKYRTAAETLSDITLTGSATLDFGNTSAQSSADLTITVTGASAGDAVALGTGNAAVLSNSSFSAWVSATNTVTVRFNNYSSGSQDPASATFKATVFKY